MGVIFLSNGFIVFICSNSLTTEDSSKLVSDKVLFPLSSSLAVVFSVCKYKHLYKFYQRYFFLLYSIVAAG